jgi:hypothetical protein
MIIDKAKYIKIKFRLTHLFWAILIFISSILPGMHTEGNSSRQGCAQREFSSNLRPPGPIFLCLNNDLLNRLAGWLIVQNMDS